MADLLPHLPDVEGYQEEAARDLLPDMPDAKTFSGAPKGNIKNQETGFGAVGQDIKQGLKDVYPSLKQFFTDLPEEYQGVKRQYYGEPSRLGKNILSGLAQGGAGLLNTPANIRDYGVKRGLISKEAPSFRLPESVLPRDYDYSAALGLGEQQPGDQLTQGLSAALPYMIGGEAGALQGLPRLGARSASQALFGTGQNINPVTAGAIPAAIELPLRGAIGTAQGAANLPARMFRGNLPPEELVANLRAAEGTNTPIGDVIGSPFLKKGFESVTSEIPFSGGEEILQKVNKQVHSRANQLMDEIRPDYLEADPNVQLKDNLVSEFEKKRQLKNTLYDDVSRLAEKEGLTVEMPTFSKMATKLKDFINESPLLKANPKFKQIYNRVLGFEEPTMSFESAILDKSGKPLISKTINPSIAEAKLIAGDLYDLSQRLEQSTNAADRYTAKVYKDLAKAARNDVKNSIQGKGSDAVKEAFNLAEDVYKTEFAPFLKKDVYRLLNPEKDPDAIAREIIKASKRNDKHGLIDRVQKLLPAKDENLLGYAYLKSAEDQLGEINPKDLAQLSRSLGRRQFKSVFPSETTRQKVQDFGRLRGMNEEALNVMHNPKTGYRSAKSLAAIVAALVGGQIGGPLGVATVGAGMGGANLANRLATSPKVRANLVNRMIENDLGVKRPTKLRPYSTIPKKSKED